MSYSFRLEFSSILVNFKDSYGRASFFICPYFSFMFLNESSVFHFKKMIARYMY